MLEQPFLSSGRYRWLLGLVFLILFLLLAGMWLMNKLQVDALYAEGINISLQSSLEADYSVDGLPTRPAISMMLVFEAMRDWEPGVDLEGRQAAFLDRLLTPVPNVNGPVAQPPTATPTRISPTPTSRSTSTSEPLPTRTARGPLASPTVDILATIRSGEATAVSQPTQTPTPDTAPGTGNSSPQPPAPAPTLGATLTATPISQPTVTPNPTSRPNPTSPPQPTAEPTSPPEPTEPPPRPTTPPEPTDSPYP